MGLTYQKQQQQQQQQQQQHHHQQEEVWYAQHVMVIAADAALKRVVEYMQVMVGVAVDCVWGSDGVDGDVDGDCDCDCDCDGDADNVCYCNAVDVSVIPLFHRLTLKCARM